MRRPRRSTSYARYETATGVAGVAAAALADAAAGGGGGYSAHMATVGAVQSRWLGWCRQRWQVCRQRQRQGGSGGSVDTACVNGCGAVELVGVVRAAAVDRQRLRHSG